MAHIRLTLWGLAFIVVCVVALLPLHALAQSDRDVPKKGITTYTGTCYGITASATALGEAGQQCVARANATGVGDNTAGNPDFLREWFVESCTTTPQPSCTYGATQTTTYENDQFPPSTVTLTGQASTQFTATTSEACPSNSTPNSSGGCTCNVGTEKVGTECVADNGCGAKLAQSAGSFQVNTGNSSAQITSACLDGCSVDVLGFGAMGRSPVDGKWTWSTLDANLNRFSGSSCVGATTGLAYKTPCPPGQVQGEVNGTTVCVASGTNSQSGTTTTTTTGPNGETIKTETRTDTTCTDGKCKETTTTTTTTTPPNGGAPTVTVGEPVEGPEQDQLSFCQENPGLAICKDTAFSGTCGNVTCTGDAVQCAMAREQSKRACELMDASTEQTQLALSAINGGLAGEHPRSPGNGPVIGLGGAIDQTNLLSAGCPTDVSFSLGGNAMSLPLSQLCTPLQLLGNALVGITMLAAVFIMFRT